MRRSVGIAAVGLCAPLGRSLQGLWERIAAGEDGFVEVDRFPLPGLPTRWASAFDGPSVQALCEEAGQRDPAVAFAILAARDAVAGLNAEERAGTALVLATSAGAADTHDAYDQARHDRSALEAGVLVGGAFTSFAGVVADDLGLEGPRTTVSTACASGGHALGIAIDLVRSGAAERVLVVGSDAVHPSLFAGFQSVGALATEPCAPFGERFGMSLGEGAGALLLEPDPTDPLGFLLGWGAACDAYHATAPDPRGDGMARALADTLADAGLAAVQVGATNAHGTGTEANDSAETYAIRAVLGDAVPVSASKSQLGHTQGAAGVLEALVTLAGLRAQAVPPTLRCEPPRKIAPADPVAAGRARSHRYEVALSHSAAFGGTNVAVLLGRAPVPRAAGGGRIYVAGVGIEAPFREAATRCRPRRADPISTGLTRAMAEAVERAGLGPGPHDGVGLVIGMADGPQESIRRFVDSRDQQGLARASAAAFARMVFNAPAGVASAELQLRGPNLTLWSGHGAGAQAILVAAGMLREHPRLEAVVAGAADELGTISRDRQDLDALPGLPMAASGALVLTREPGAVELLGASWGSAGQVDAVVARALAGRAVDRVILSAGKGFRPVLDGSSVVELDSVLGHAAATSGVLGSAAAIDWIVAGVARSVLVLSVARDSGCTALLWGEERRAGRIAPNRSGS